MTELDPPIQIYPINICVCTFKRPQVVKTLASLARLTLKPDWAVHVIVADNDEQPSAEILVETAAKQYGIKCTYVHAPSRNISIARNACLTLADAPLVAFIDDDEIAHPEWLNALVSEFESSKADVVLGQVKSIYKPEYPEWMKKGDFHTPKPVWVAGDIITGYTCNVLFNRAPPMLRPIKFREEFGRTGGEDTMFFAAVHKAGGRFSYAPDAIVTEEVTTQRASFAWLFKRFYRSGQTHGQFLLENHGPGLVNRLKNTAIALFKAVFCFTMSVFNATAKVRATYWVLRGTLHLGAVSRLLGKRKLEQYG